jgi:uncharacterized protein with NRDE domain
MCLLVLSLDQHERYQLVFAGNRDEFHGRPARAAHWWTDAPSILAGRDLEAGGTWLGITRNGRFAAVTNYRETEPGGHARKASRGELVSNFLRSGEPAAAYAGAVQRAGHRYRGFCLIVGDLSGLWFVSNRADGARRLEPGIFGLSNQLLDVPWPKVVRAKSRLAELLEHDVAPSDLLDLLGDRTLLRDTAPRVGPEAALERAASAIFVSAPSYGTRCSTAITITRGGHVEFAERSFDSLGEPTGEQRFEFRIEAREAP